LKSANDAAVALAESVAGSEESFVDLMNNKATAVGDNREGAKSNKDGSLQIGMRM